MARKGPGPDGPLQTALLESTSAATTRAADGQKVFSPIAAFLDKHRSQTAGLALQLAGALNALSNELASVAERHFNAYISGIPLTNIPPCPSSSPAPYSLPPTPPPSRPPSGLNQSSYATVAQSAPAKADARAQPRTSTKKTIPLVRQPLPDYRLFVRLPTDHAARKMEAYAIYCSLRAQLTLNTALKEVQITKTGFALCPPSPDALPALESQMDIISAFFVNCQIERSSRWVSYRVTNIPRKIGQILEGRYSLIPVNPTILSTEITESTGLKPISISETTASAANTSTLSSSWFINFPEGTKPTLPTQLRLFGMITNARLLSKRTSVTQCTRCWKWHNTRSCARPPRCRLCGSSEHTEEGHVNRCAAPDPHLCPPRCLHCHGPHVADDPECLLRPKGNTKYTKSQQAEIRKTCATNLAKARAEKGCSSQLSTGTQDLPMTLDETPSQSSAQEIMSPFRPVTPPPRAPTEDPPVTARAVRFNTPQPQNRFASLLEQKL